MSLTSVGSLITVLTTSGPAFYISTSIFNLRRGNFQNFSWGMPLDPLAEHASHNKQAGPLNFAALAIYIVLTIYESPSLKPKPCAAIPFDIFLYQCLVWKTLHNTLTYCL